MPEIVRPVIFGEVLFDQFPDGSVVLGGAPFNVARHLQAFGAQPLLISRVGDDPLGRQVREAMTRWGMDLAGLQLDSSHPTGRVTVEIEQGEPHFSILPDQAYDHIDAHGLPPLPRKAVLYHGSLALRHADSRGAFEVLRQRLQAPAFVDVNLRPPWWTPEQVQADLDAAEWAKLNEDELGLLAPPGAPEEPVAQAAALQEARALSLIIVTRGEAGAFARKRDGELHQVAPGTTVEVVDAVGAGDAFAAVSLLGLLRSWPLPVILERAQDFASAVVGIRGAVPADDSFYTQYLDAWS